MRVGLAGAGGGGREDGGGAGGSVGHDLMVFREGEPLGITRLWVSCWRVLVDVELRNHALQGSIVRSYSIFIVPARVCGGEGLPDCTRLSLDKRQQLGVSVYSSQTPFISYHSIRDLVYGFVFRFEHSALRSC